MSFDTLIDRTDSDSLKWGKYKNKDILPMWVADMDFRCAEPILEALKRRVDHGVFGYALAPDSAAHAVVDWVAYRHHWQIQPDWIVWVPGLVSALNVVCRGFAEPGDDVITFTPIYPPFMDAPRHFNQNLIEISLPENEPMRSGIEQLNSVCSPGRKVLLLCNPHNPTGKCWSREELTRLAEICLEKNLLICSDEIHCDLILSPDKQHTPTASLNQEIARQTITLMSAGKTFNLPGLNCGFAIIPNEDIRRRFKRAAEGIVPYVNTMGYISTETAFNQCRQWHRDLIDYLRTNRNYLYETIETDIPQLKMALPEATYLAWLDPSELKIDNPVRFFQQAGVALSGGKPFGRASHVRLNFGCPKSALTEGLNRIKSALRK